MTISARIRPVTMITAITLALGLGAFAVATAYAQTAAPARPARSAACELGGKLITPTAVRTDKLGVKYYTYRAIPDWSPRFRLAA
jgi:hypothetical protein